MSICPPLVAELLLWVDHTSFANYGWPGHAAPPETFKIMQQSTHPDLGVRMLQAMEHVMQAGAAKVPLFHSAINQRQPPCSGSKRTGVVAAANQL